MMRHLTRFRPDPILMVLAIATASAFTSGAAVGVLATMPAIAQPAQVQACNGTSDVIACLIAEADEVEEPPQR